MEHGGGRTCRWLVLLSATAVAMPALAAGDGAETYEVYCRHWLRNKTDRPVEKIRVWLPIPQDSEYQQIQDFKVELWDQPLTSERTVDRFGQPLIRITIDRLGPGAEIEVGYSCVAALREPPRVHLDPGRAGALDDIPAGVREMYTDDVAGMYDLKSPEIQRWVAELSQAHPNLVERAIALHDFVAGRLKYSRGGGWDAAPVVLRRGNGSCSEFTFLLCALCRAGGLPTRMVGASVCREKKLPYEDTVWHRWAEVYLPPYGWVPFDATADRGRPPKHDFVGTFKPHVLIVSQCGGGPPLGKSYVGANSHHKELERKHAFVWTQGAREAFARADTLQEQGEYREALRAFRDVVARHTGSRWARVAEERIKRLQRDVGSPGGSPPPAPVSR
jgi:transglutaminase-like putative cysteine protease